MNEWSILWFYWLLRYSIMLFSQILFHTIFFHSKLADFHQDWYMSWPKGNFSCKLVGGFFTYINFLATSWFLTIMSIDRYMSLKHRKRKKRTFEYSSKICGYVWLVATMECSEMKIWPPRFYSGVYLHSRTLHSDPTSGIPDSEKRIVLRFQNQQWHFWKKL